VNQEKKTAIYCRVALSDDFAIDMQEKQLRIYAEQEGYADIEVYSDNGASGNSFDRSALNRLKADIISGKIGTVIAVSLSRIGRDTVQTFGWVESLKRHGIKLDTLDKSHEFSLCYAEFPVRKDRRQER